MAQSKVSLKLLMIVVAVIAQVVAIEGCAAGNFKVEYPTETRCIACNSCPPGYGSNYNCDYGAIIKFEKLKTIKCIPCPAGTYKASLSYKECTTCTKCPSGLTGISPCTNTSNTICGCGEGQRLDSDGSCKGKLLPPTKNPSTHKPTRSPNTTTKLYRTRISPTPTDSNITDSRMNIGIVIAIIISVLFAIHCISAVVVLICKRKACRKRATFDDLEQEMQQNTNRNPAADPCGNSNDHYMDLEAEQNRRDNARKILKALPPEQGKERIMRTIYGDSPFATDKKMLKVLSRHLKENDFIKIYDKWLWPLKKCKQVYAPPQNVPELVSVCQTLVPEWTFEQFLDILIGMGQTVLVEEVCHHLINKNHEDDHSPDILETQSLRI